MSTFHVFIDGATDPAPGSIERLAEAMAARYGLPAADLVTRISRGRFRVKSNIDRATAETYARDLIAIGARAVVEDGAAAPARGAAATPATGLAVVARAVTKPATPATGLPAVARAATKPPQFQSGLAAAFAPSDVTTDLGALGDGALTLASVDGGSIGGPALGAFEPPAPPDDTDRDPRPRVVTFKPATTLKAATSADEFAPPAESAADQQVDIATDELDYRARKSSIPPASVPIPSTATATPAMRRSSNSTPPATHVATKSDGVLASPRARMVIGVVLAIGIGFIPAQLFATMRAPAGRAIDAAVIDRQQHMSTLEDYEALDAFRADQLARKESQHRTTAIAAMLIWVVVGVGLGYVWFRRVPWDRINGA